MSYQLLSESNPKARKRHLCTWCGQAIEIGQKYIRENSVYDGNMQDHKFHVECRDQANKEFNESHDEEFMPGDNERPTTTK